MSRRRQLKFRKIEPLPGQLQRFTVTKCRVLIGYVYSYQTRVVVTTRRVSTYEAYLDCTSVEAERWGLELLDGKTVTRDRIHSWLNPNDSGFRTRQDAACELRRLTAPCPAPIQRGKPSTSFARS